MIRKIVIIMLIAIAKPMLVNAQIYIANKCEISFFSPTSIEDITATNSACKPLLNVQTGSLQMKIPMTSFIFEKPLMQEHFNENYVESEKFPYGIYRGKINEKIDVTKNGEYSVTSTGKLVIHGVEKERTISGLMTIKNGEITLSSTFNIIFADHDVKIPALYSSVFPPDTKVKINAKMVPFKKELN